MRRAIVLVIALVGILIGSTQEASAADCSVVVRVTAWDAYNNVVSDSIFQALSIGQYSNSSDCVLNSGGALSFRANQVCLNHLSAVPFSTLGDVYFGGSFVQSVGGGGSCRTNFNLNYYTTLGSGQSLSPGNSLSSYNGDYELRYQTDANLVLYQGSSAVWAINCWPVCNNLGNPGVTTMQTDGNFVVYDDASNAVWNSGTAGNSGAFLALREGKLVIFATNGSILWQAP